MRCLKHSIKKAGGKKQELENWQVQNKQTETNQLTKKDSHQTAIGRSGRK